MSKVKIICNDLGKKFNRNWIFKNLSTTIEPGQIAAITGHNGSGKSTLLKIIGGFLTASRGEIKYEGISENDLQTNLNFAAPYQNLIEEFTLTEHLDFHEKFKAPLKDRNMILEESGLSEAKNKLISEFSSGMKQRLRLAMVFFYESEMILLDEPTSNLDHQGMDWYDRLIADSSGKTIIIASNQPKEYLKAGIVIDLENFKL